MRTYVSRIVSMLAGCGAGLVLGAAPAAANCALIPAALAVLPSLDGGVDRPFAAPGDTVTVFSDGACKADASFPHFSTSAARNQVTITFLPPTGAPPAPTQVLGSGVADCGTDRCFALDFQIPLDIGFSGPARIEVQNLDDTPLGVPEAVVQDLFEPAKGCNLDNRISNLFQTFTVLPALNAYGTSPSATLRATVDGAGALLIPFDFSAQLTAAIGGTGSVRLLNVSANLANGLVGGNGLPVDPSLLRLPRGQQAVRSFSLGGRPIPPLLEVTASNPTLEATGFGDTIVGSVDFKDSVIRITKFAEDPNAPGTQVQTFALANEGDGSGPAFAGGEISLSGIDLSAGAAAPLNSLRSSTDVAVVARDEALEAQFGGTSQNPGDSDTNDKIVTFVDLSSGGTVTTQQPVVEVAFSPRKALVAVGGPQVAFVHSEAADGRTDFFADGESLDGALRVWTSDPALCTPPLSSCELAVPGGDVSVNSGIRFEGPAGPSSLVFSGPPGSENRFLFFPRSEFSEAAVEAFRVSVTAGGGDTTRASFDAAPSGDGSKVVYVSTDPAITGVPPVVWETGTLQLNVRNVSTVPTLTGTFGFDPGAVGVPDIDYAALGSGQLTLFFQPQGDPLGELFDLWGNWQIGAGSSFNAVIDDPLTDPATGVATIPGGIVFNGLSVSSAGDWDALSVSPPAGGVTPQQAKLQNLRSTSVGVVSGVFFDPVFGLLDGYDVNGTFQQLGDFPQVYLRDTFTLTNELISKSAGGVAGDCSSRLPSTDFTGNTVAFLSCASNLVPGGGGANGDQVFVVDRGAGTIERASEAAAGGESDGSARTPVVDASGRFVAYISSATDLVAGVTGELFEVYLYDTLSKANELVSLDSGGQASGSALFPGLGIGVVPDTGQPRVAFASDATDLVPGLADGNGVADVFVRDRAPGTTRLVSGGFAGAEADGESLDPHLSADGDVVVFTSAATNLLAPEVPTNGVVQCYAHELGSGATTLVSATLGGAPADAACEDPFVSPSGRFVTFASAATNLFPGTDATRRVYLYDRLTGVVELLSRDPLGTPFPDPAGPRSGVVAAGAALSLHDTPTNVVNATGPADTNGVSDVYGFRITGATPDLNGNGFTGDTLLYVYDVETQSLQNTLIALDASGAGKVAVGGGRAAVVPADGSAGRIYDPFLQTTQSMFSTVSGSIVPVALALSESVYCAIDGGGFLHVGEPVLGRSTQRIPNVAQAKAVGDRCVYRDQAGTLGIVQLSGATVATGVPVEDFQLGTDGVAFRTCEAAAGADLNGDLDQQDCVMRFWWFTPPAGVTNPVETGHTAVPCTFPGCDPFFEPYRVGPGILSFVTDEKKEVDEETASGARGLTCLPTSPPGICDKTGNRTGDDVAVEIFNLASNRAQVFPVKRENPPQVNPFPEVEVGDTNNMIAIQLPAEIAGPAFASLPPDQPVTLVAGSADGDAVFEADGNTDPSTAVADLCQQVANASQTDADQDGMGAQCDLAVDPVTMTLAPNDSPTAPVAAAAIPGDMPCNLSRTGPISRAEVDQIWADRGTPIDPPFLDGMGVLRAADDRDKDKDGAITAADFQLCLAACVGQAGGCPATDADATPAGYKACGLVGPESLLLLVPWWLWRRRKRR